MLAALAGLAGLIMMRNPRKRRKARKHRRMRRNARPNENEIPTVKIVRKGRRNPSLHKRRSAAKKRMIKKYEGINRRTFKSPWSSYPGHSKLARRHKQWLMAIRAGISHGRLASARARSVRHLRTNPRRRKGRRNPINTGDVALATLVGMRGNPGKRRKGRKVSPGAAAARLANWRWHHNPLRPGTEGYEIPKGYKSAAGRRLGEEIRRGENPVYAFDVALIVARNNGDHVAFKTLTADRKLLMQCKNLTQGEHVAKQTARDLGYTGRF